MTSSQRDSNPRPSLFERVVREVINVVDARSGGRVHSVVNEWLDGAGRVCEQAKSLDPNWRLSGTRTRAEIAAMVRATVRGTDEDLRVLQDAAGSGPLPAARLRNVAEQVIACSLAAFTPRQVLHTLARHTTRARSAVARPEPADDHATP